jgi:FixJ family two-component response regulator
MSAENIKPTVYIVDDDDSVRRAIKRLIHSAGMKARTFASASEFLKSMPREENACLIADVKMPGISGLDLHRKLIAGGSKLPVIFITAFDAEEIRAQAKETGGVGYFRKPVDDQALLDAIQWALSRRGSH